MRDLMLQINPSVCFEVLCSWICEIQVRRPSYPSPLNRVSTWRGDYFGEIKNTGIMESDLARITMIFFSKIPAARPWKRRVECCQGGGDELEMRHLSKTLPCPCFIFYSIKEDIQRHLYIKKKHFPPHTASINKKKRQIARNFQI